MTAALSASDAAVALPGSRLGLVSDSHGKIERTRRAVALLLERGADAILHLGDICDEDVLDALVGLRGAGGVDVPARALLGNMDLDPHGMTRYADSLGVPIDHPAGRYRMSGKSIAAHHGHLRGFEERAGGEGADYYLHGHTHRARDERRGGVRVINPGAIMRAPRHTCALLDCAGDEVTFFEIESGAMLSVEEALSK